MDEKEKIEFLETTLARIIAWVNNADAKAERLSIVCAAMLAALVAVVSSDGFSQILATEHRNIVLTALSIMMLPLFVCLGIALAVYFPRTQGPKESVIYFQRIAEITQEEYRNKINKLSNSAYIDDLIAQCHRNAQIATTRFQWVSMTAILLYVNIAVWIAVFSFLLVLAMGILTC